LLLLAQRFWFLENAQLRLGLSATPDRWYDEKGTKAIYDYFGSLIEPVYSIEDAIENIKDAIKGCLSVLDADMAQGAKNEIGSMEVVV